VRRVGGLDGAQLSDSSSGLAPRIVV
jgi:hypothetical protein